MNTQSSNFLLIGNPNAGKTLLFNRLTGRNQKVANYPGITIDVVNGKMNQSNIIDFPGIYSFNAISQEEEIAINQFNQLIENENTKGIACIVDTTKLPQTTSFLKDIYERCNHANKVLIVIFNMIDEIPGQSSLNFNQLEKLLGIKAFPISAKKKIGLTPLINFIQALEGNSEVYQAQLSQQKAQGQKSITENQLQQQFSNLNINFNQLRKKYYSLDGLFLHKILGPILFTLIMFFLFQSIFAWAAPLMDLVEEVIGAAGNWVSSSIDNQMLKSLINDALFAGLGSFLVFVPQIFILTALISLLEDSGYLARATVISHRTLKFFGMSGKSFVPYLTGFACAIPAIMATRVIESKRKRLISLLTIPLLPCSARIPVFALLVSVLVPMESYGGLVNSRGIAFFIIYLGSLGFALIVSTLLAKFLPDNAKTNEDQFILELPAYRAPALSSVLRKAGRDAWAFITKAGPIIFTVSFIIWILGYFPSQGNLQDSYLGMIGKYLEPIFEPLGLDWKFSIAIILSFLAREVFVSTLGTLFGLENAEESIGSLSEMLTASGFTLASGAALLVFFIIALQCVATVAIIKKETKSNLFAWGTLGIYNVVAYIFGFITYVLLS
ncbi:ferrous iron transporter B [Bacteriovoracaceae bacterium]|nr:ferrous iron transporter B [Bacteriovoracaceae bacterium]